MPCHLKQIAKVVWGPNTSPALMGKALESMGYSVKFQDKAFIAHTSIPVDFNGLFANHPDGSRISFNSIDNRLIYQGNKAFDESQVKRAYSVAVVEDSARRMGWPIRWTNQEELEFEVVKRI